MAQTHDEVRIGGKKDRAYFARVRKAEAQYARKLRKVARQVGELTGAFDPLDLTSMEECRKALEGYETIIESWARSAAGSMISDVMRRDESAWAALSKEMSRNLRREIQTAPLGGILRSYIDEQVRLITGLPRDAAERVQKLALEAHTATGARRDVIAKEIMRTGEVTTSVANQIARTQISSISTSLTAARAQHVGSEGYVWRTAEDGDVRESHKAMDGKFCRWDTPPTLPDGTKTHAGMDYNCRCWPEPVLPDVIQ